MCQKTIVYELNVMYRKQKIKLHVSGTLSVYMHGLGNQSYDVRPKALNEHSLESRRIRAQLPMCYKMLHGLVDIDCHIF